MAYLTLTLRAQPVGGKARVDRAARTNLRGLPRGDPFGSSCWSPPDSPREGSHGSPRGILWDIVGSRVGAHVGARLKAQAGARVGARVGAHGLPWDPGKPRAGAQVSLGAPLNAVGARVGPHGANESPRGLLGIPHESLREPTGFCVGAHRWHQGIMN